MFLKINDLESLKIKYRELAKIFHPDVGGTVEVMQEVNEAFERRYNYLKAIGVSKPKASSEVGVDRAGVDETARGFIRHFYTANGWEGSNYNPHLYVKDIAKIVRDAIKEMFPLCKFSITCDVRQITVALMEAPYQVYRPEITERYTQLNHYYIDRDKSLVPEAIEMWLCIKELIFSYNYDDSDIQTDYFDTNFYIHFSVGKWNKPFEVVSKTARIGVRPNFKDKGVDIVTSTDTSSATSSTIPQIAVADILLEEGTLVVEGASTPIKLQLIQTTDTRDNSLLYLVTMQTKLSRDDFVVLKDVFKIQKGAYSKFKRGFIFKTRPNIPFDDK